MQALCGNLPLVQFDVTRSCVAKACSACFREEKEIQQRPREYEWQSLDIILLTATNTFFHYSGFSLQDFKPTQTDIPDKTKWCLLMNCFSWTEM